MEAAGADAALPPPDDGDVGGSGSTRPPPLPPPPAGDVVPLSFVLSVATTNAAKLLSLSVLVAYILARACRRACSTCTAAAECTTTRETPRCAARRVSPNLFCKPPVGRPCGRRRRAARATGGAPAAAAPDRSTDSRADAPTTPRRPPGPQDPARKSWATSRRAC
jgi:hypothetical protein